MYMIKSLLGFAVGLLAVVAMLALYVWLVSL